MSQHSGGRRLRAAALVVLPLLAAGLMTAVAVRAQGAPSGVVVLGQGWGRSRPPSPALYEDPLAVAAEQARLEGAQKETIRQNKVREKANLEQLPIPQRAGGEVDRRRPPGPAGYVYTYTVRVRNDGARKVRRLDWEYLVVDPASGREAGRHRFTSKVGVSPGQTKKLVGRSASPPSDTVDAQAGADGAPARYAERVVIRRVEYDDGSVWEGAAN